MQGFNQDEQSIVVVPSITLKAGPGVAARLQALEERFLFLLLLLRQPRARLVYVTSQAINPSIVGYYLDLLPGVVGGHARRRLFLPSLLDGSAKQLTQKVLERPRFLDRLRALIPDPDRAHLIPYNTTVLERDLAVRLGIPMYGADPRFFPLGTKSGCRQLFAEESLPHPGGFEDLRTLAGVAEAIAKMRAERPGMERVLVKLNEGVSGSGNATVDLGGLPEPGGQEELAAIEARVRGMHLESAVATIDGYLADLERDGGVVEELITGEEIRSPSVQLRVTPLGEVELLSTHDQVLGGPTGQKYLGARFPADAAYAGTISREAMKVGHRLAREGVIGRFALDFLTVRQPGGGWSCHAIELNLRKGGTTHPFLTLQFLTDGTYDGETGVFTAPSGRAKYFVASDHVESDLYRALTPDDLFDIVALSGLHFDQPRQTGVVFHMMSALPELGRTGMTAVGDSPEAADELYARAVTALDEGAADAARARGLPEA